MYYRWHDKLHLVTKKYKFISIVKSVESSLPKFCEILPKFSTNQNFEGVCSSPSPPTPTPLTSSIYIAWVKKSSRFAVSFRESAD